MQRAACAAPTTTATVASALKPQKAAAAASCVVRAVQPGPSAEPPIRPVSPSVIVPLWAFANAHRVPPRQIVLDRGVPQRSAPAPETQGRFAPASARSLLTVQLACNVWPKVDLPTKSARRQRAWPSAAAVPGPPQPKPRPAVSCQRALFLAPVHAVAAPMA